MKTSNSTDKIQTAKPPVKWLVRHFGINHTERNRLRRVMRSLPNGHSEKNTARAVLQKSPKNYPVRKVMIDNRKTYIFEPHFQAGMQAFRAAWNTQTAFLPEKPGKSQVESVFVAASRAFVQKIVELTKQTAPQNA